LSDLQSNHDEFLRLARELHDTQDPDRAREISNRLAVLNREYFGTVPDSEELRAVVE